MANRFFSTEKQDYIKQIMEAARIIWSEALKSKDRSPEVEVNDSGQITIFYYYLSLEESIEIADIINRLYREKGNISCIALASERAGPGVLLIDAGTDLGLESREGGFVLTQDSVEIAAIIGQALDPFVERIRNAQNSQRQECGL